MILDEIRYMIDDIRNHPKDYGIPLLLFIAVMLVLLFVLVPPSDGWTKCKELCSPYVVESTRSTGCVCNQTKVFVEFK